MICLLTKNQLLKASLEAGLQHAGIAHISPDPEDSRSLEVLYSSDILGAVVDSSFPQIPGQAWIDMIETLGQRMPVFVSDFARSKDDDSQLHFCIQIDPVNLERSIEFFAKCQRQAPAVGETRRSIPVYNPQVANQYLRRDGCLSILAVDSTAFHKISLSCGQHAYHQVQNAFHQILFDSWGTPGFFRTKDMLCREHATSDIYFILLESSRMTGGVPKPGALEALTDRLILRWQEALWNALPKTVDPSLISTLMPIISEVTVGHQTILANPCLDGNAIMHNVIRRSLDSANLQMRRSKAREREFLHSLIHAQDVLYPHYQAVFQLSKLTPDLIKETKRTNSIAPIKNHLYGFESLIRIRRDALSHAVGSDSPINLAQRNLRPDILFAIAQHLKTALELDQKCFSLAILHAQELPGTLMINILPRNFYRIDHLLAGLPHSREIMLELSETENIDNLALLQVTREKLHASGIGIAADDFGKGFSSLERVLDTRPNVIKLDRGLVKSVHNDKPRQGFIKGLAEIAHSIGSLLLAEGVEQIEEAIALQDIGVELIQGFLLHRPEECSKILQELQSAVGERESSVA